MKTYIKQFKWKIMINKHGYIARHINRDKGILLKSHHIMLLF